MKQRFVELLPATSIFLGIVAVVFSWKALSIAKETEQRVLGELSQLNPNVVVGVAEPYTRSASIGNGGSVLCTQRIRLINEGASPTSLVGFTLWLRDGNRKENYFTLESSAEEASTGNPREFNFSSGINGFYGWLSLDDFKTAQDQDNSENPLAKALLPVQIDANSATDLRSTFGFSVAASRSKVLDLVNPDKSLLMVLEYTFYFASGQTLYTPEMQCFP